MKKYESNDILRQISQLEYQPYLLAVSGGMDSMVMLDAFYKLKQKFAVAHCNFNLRKASNEDQVLVKNFCEERGIIFHEIEFNTQDYALEHKISIEMAARELRYSWFFYLLEKFQYLYVVTAHHEKDQVETFFINLCRGSGIRGLSGMKKFSNKILRPFLTISKQTLEEYVIQNNVKYLEDETNAKNIYLRNRIRNTVLPIFEDIDPQFKQNVVRTMSYLKQTEEFVNDRIKDLKSQITKEINGDLIISIPQLKSHSNVNFILFEILRPYSFPRDIVNMILSSSHTSGSKFMSENYMILINREDIIISPIVTIDKNTYSINENEIISSPISLIYTEKTDKKNSLIERNPQKAFLDYDMLQFPLNLRRWRLGDIFQPLGMNGKMKLSDFFINKKLSIKEKENVWILESNGNIIWIVGHQIDHRYRIKESTKFVYVLEAKS